MRNSFKTIMVIMISCFPFAFGDYLIDYYEYTHIPEIGVIKFESGHFRSEKSHKKSKEKRSELEKQGIYIADNKEKRTIIKECVLGNYNIKSCLTIYPPANTNYGGANYTANIKIEVNNKIKLDCSLGYEPRTKDLNIHQIVIYEDGIISINGFYLSENSVERKVEAPLDYLYIDNQDLIISNDVFFKK